MPDLTATAPDEITDYSGYRDCGHPEYRNTADGPQANDCGCDGVEAHFARADAAMTTELPAWAEYTVTVGEQYAEYLEQSGHALGGLRIMDLGDGRAVLDAEAVRQLQAQPEDADGSIDADMQLWLQGGSFAVVPAEQAEPDARAQDAS